jgi:hypothetical protein
MLETLLDSPAVGSMAHEGLANLLIDQARFAEATRLIDAARGRWPDEYGFLLDQLLLEIARSNVPAAATAARTLAARAGDEDHALFVAAIGEFLTVTDKESFLSRDFFDTIEADYYRDYLTLIVFAFEDEDGREDARQALADRWAGADLERWPDRLAHGDPEVWREMLIGYYLGEMPRERLLAPLANEATFEASSFSKLPLSRQGMLCEFYFYDALLAKAHGDREGMIRGLEAAIQRGYRPYLEYEIAKFLLKRERGGPDEWRWHVRYRPQ